jgi:hypothetical protein
MNIIEAMQQAENGKLITNNFLKMSDKILKYMGKGVFYQYQIINGKPEYKYPVRNFDFAEIISNAWEVVTTQYFENESRTA